ncbi:hypothetical protein CRU99_03835 [Malaciobacter mytili]|uniref:hypothetical protein n=1 Tax=Malaciobacter mytili TaxID=603050 RepID=UPI00100BA6F5|nr:hypothetical protein [Malaciobacter mytili]RXI45439.1 hypothetical protein CRU99_03835 [Malaciobacter mytili]
MRQVYDYKEFQKEMKSKKKRTGNKETFTPIDFFTQEEIDEFNKKGINNLEPYLPIPDYIRKHDKFVCKVHRELLKKYPNDEFLHSLDKEENIEIFFTYTWYEKYGIKYDNK